MRQNIAILMGGYSSEYDISIKSGNVVYNTLSTNSKNEFYKVIIDKNSWYHLDDKSIKHPIDKESFDIILKDKRIKIDKVFNTIHGEPGENGEIQSFLEGIKINQTSSNAKQSRLTFNKSLCKEEVEKFGIITPKSMVFKLGDIKEISSITNKIKLPFFIKPNEGGSSFGISRVTKEKDIINSLKKCYKENSDALIEEEITGREISVGVIWYKNSITALPPTEIVSHNDFFDFDAKYNGQSDEITPAEIDREYIEEVKKLAVKIYKKLKLKGFTRSDFILKNNKFYFLEVNTNPGLTAESILPQQAKAAGIDLKELFESVLN